MAGFFFENVFQPGHFIGDESPWLLVFQSVDFSFVIFDLFIDVLKLLFYDIGRRLQWDEPVLFFRRSTLVLLLFQHLIYLDDLVFQFAVALLQLLDIFGPEWERKYLMSSDSFSFSCKRCLLECGVSRKSLPLYLCILLLFINNYIAMFIDTHTYVIIRFCQITLPFRRRSPLFGFCVRLDHQVIVSFWRIEIRFMFRKVFLFGCGRIVCIFCGIAFRRAWRFWLRRVYPHLKTCWCGFIFTGSSISCLCFYHFLLMGAAAYQSSLPVSASWSW